MSGHLIDRVRCWLGFTGHTFAVKFRDNAQGRPVAGYECVRCHLWKASPFAELERR